MRADAQVDQVFNRDYWNAQTIDVTSDLYSGIVEAADAALFAQYGLSFDVTNELAADWIAKRANFLSGAVTDTTYQGIKDELVQGQAAGESIDKLAQRISGLFDQTYKNRARTVARTEVIGGFNGATHQLIANTPEDLVTGLEWIATRDSRTRKAHAQMDGKIIRRGEAFILDGAEMAFPGDPDTVTRMNSLGEIPDPRSMIINCRCTIAPVVAADMPADMQIVPATASPGPMSATDADYDAVAYNGQSVKSQETGSLKWSAYTADEQGTINKYVRMDKQTLAMNKKLRAGKALGAEQQQLVDELTEMSRKGSFARDSKVYRTAVLDQKLVDQMDAGFEMVDKGIMSTAISEADPRFYLESRLKTIRGQGVLMRITAKAGQPVIPMGYDEFVFAPGTRMRVLAKGLDPDGLTVMDMEMF